MGAGASTSPLSVDPGLWEGDGETWLAPRERAGEWCRLSKTDDYCCGERRSPKCPVSKCPHSRVSPENTAFVTLTDQGAQVQPGTGKTGKEIFSFHDIHFSTFWSTRDASGGRKEEGALREKSLPAKLDPHLHLTALPGPGGRGSLTRLVGVSPLTGCSSPCRRHSQCWERWFGTGSCLRHL